MKLLYIMNLYELSLSMNYHLTLFQQAVLRIPVHQPAYQTVTKVLNTAHVGP